MVETPKKIQTLENGTRRKKKARKRSFPGPVTTNFGSEIKESQCLLAPLIIIKSTLERL